MKTMTLKAYLEQSLVLDKVIDVKLHQLEELSRYFEICSSLSREKANHVITRIEKLQNEINSEIDRLVDKKIEISHFINVLEDATLRTMIEYYYLCGFTWDAIAEKLFISLRQLHNWRKKALRLLEEEYIKLNAST